METEKQRRTRIRRRFKKVIDKSPEFLNVDRKKMLNLLCNWFFENKRQIEKQELDNLIEQARNRG